MSPDWRSFFSTYAQIAVTAFSIMFLSMQVRSSVWRGKRLLSVAAYAALAELSVPLLAALICIMGGHPWRIGSLLAGGLGIGMVVIHWWVYFIERQKERPSAFDRIQIRGSLLSLFVYGLVALSAANVHDWGLQLLAAMCVWLPFSGCYEAWWLLEPKGIVARDEEHKVPQSDADAA